MLHTNTCILHVLLPVPLRKPYFEYLPPEHAANLTDAHIGCRVQVPFGHQTLIGVIRGVAKSAATPRDKLRACDRLIDANPLIPASLFVLSDWAAQYYHHPVGETLFTFLPSYLREGHPASRSEKIGWKHTIEGLGLPATALKRSPKQQQLHQLLLQHGTVQQSELTRQEIAKSVVNTLIKKGLIEAVVLPAQNNTPLHNEQSKAILKTSPLPLSEEQQKALQAIRHHDFGVYLLEGVTGSGKTEVYLQAIAQTLQRGKQALVLVPEIGLTPQTLSRFEKRFHVPMVILNSNVAKKRRAQDWLAATQGEAAIVIGTRSAAATPLPHLGIIIIDEEHDLSFKQMDGLRYSARDLAVVRAKQQSIPLLMGSATPSLESLLNTQLGRYTHLKLKQRAVGEPPKIQTLDLRQHPVNEAGMSQATLTAISDTLATGKQVLVFINRRGYAPSLVCQHCGWAASCKACDTKLTLHQQPRQLRCHQCDARQGVPRVCPHCRSDRVIPLGIGTERCETFLSEYFEKQEGEAAVLRVDADSMSRKTAMTDLQSVLEQGKPCILVGTQMLAKGHHFPNITLVVMLDIDTHLFSSDFRGIERMGQLLTQVAGRAGRGDTPGEVLLQTYRPEHPLLQLLIGEGYGALARQVLGQREHTQLPPYRFMALIRAESKRAENATAFLKQALACARALFPPSPSVTYLGPLPSLIEKRQDRWRFQAQIVCLHRADRQNLLTKLLPEIDQLALSKRVRWAVDVDPLDVS